MFVAGARVFIQGCNVADTDEGRKFLVEFAKVFLSKGGGRVGASTSLGLTFRVPWGSKVYHAWGDTIYAYINRGGTKVRVCVGKELTTPSGQWLVKSGSSGWYYWFSSSNTVSYQEDSTFGGAQGNGSFELKDGLLSVRWQSGSSEEWELPLFTKEQPIAWRKTDGSINAMVAEKILDSNRLID
jgi:hypothetical protein